MAVEKPTVVAVAGPNGAGKSTAGPLLVERVFGIRSFVNADVIARGLSAFEPESVAIEAGRILLRRIADLGRQRRSFAFETTLAGRGHARRVAELKGNGYEFHILYFWLPDADMALRRVQARVSEGGHAIPPEVVRRRYDRSVQNFLTLYGPLADSWRLYDNSRAEGPRLVARRRQDLVRESRDVWDRLLRGDEQATRAR